MPTNNQNEDQTKNDPSKSCENNEQQHPQELRNETDSGVMLNTNPTINSPQLLVFDESAISKLVAARLDLPIPQPLLDQNFKSSIIKRCWEDQLQQEQDYVKDVNPFTVHSERSSHCSFICSSESSLSSSTPSLLSSTDAVRNTLISKEQENSSKRLKIETVYSDQLSNTLFKTDLLQQIRRRTFSHWPHRTIPSSAQMIEAGFFNCNVGDRVICIYCNLICQQWTSHTDDPCEVHKTLSPKCIYVKSKLIDFEALPIINTDGHSMGAAADNHSPSSNNLCSLGFNEIAFTAAYNSVYTEVPKRYASFATWPHENLPSVDDLVRAGFFYIGIKTIVTCFYCNGSLKNWDPNANPMIEHARCFPHCAYAKQLCGDEIHRKIQESKREEQERAGTNKSGKEIDSSAMLNDNLTINSRQLFILDESYLSRLVADRLRLPISQSLLDQNFKLAIIKRCWEDQLRLKREDFISDLDLKVACLILQKQEHIAVKQENIVVPSIKMAQIREQNKRMCEQSSTTPNATQLILNTTDADAATAPKSLTNETTSITISNQNQLNDSTPSNPCVLCLTEEKNLAFIPCGHLISCVPCGHSLRSCPICRREIEALVRIYV